MDVVAEHHLDAIYPDGQKVPVHVRIGRPRLRPLGKGEWGCVVQAEGLRIWEGPFELVGEGSLHALMIAASFLHNMLSAEVERGAVLHWKGSAEVLCVDGLFVFPDHKNGNPGAAADGAA